MKIRKCQPGAPGTELPVPAVPRRGTVLRLQRQICAVKRNRPRFKELLAGKYDEPPEQAFMFVGTIEEAAEKARQLGQ